MRRIRVYPCANMKKISIFNTALLAGKGLLRTIKAKNPWTGANKLSAIIPIRSVGSGHRKKILRHLLILGKHDRYLRFGYMANDEQIRRYVDAIDFAQDAVFGIFNRKLDLLAMAHLAHGKATGMSACAEFGVSVVPSARGRGYGTRLFERAAAHASNDGVRMMFIHALSENTAMLRIAKNAGAVFERDGSETEGYLSLPAASLESHLTELVKEQFAKTDYGLKLQAQQFWSALRDVQQIRQGAIDALKRSNR